MPVVALKLEVLPSDTAPGARECAAPWAQAEQLQATYNRAANSVHRRHPGSESYGTAQAAPHRPSDLAILTEKRDQTLAEALRARTQKKSWMVNACDLRAAELRVGPKGQVDWCIVTLSLAHNLSRSCTRLVSSKQVHVANERQATDGWRMRSGCPSLPGISRMIKDVELSRFAAG
jgi:hypothetical protein